LLPPPVRVAVGRERGIRVDNERVDESETSRGVEVTHDVANDLERHEVGGGLRTRGHVHGESEVRSRDVAQPHQGADGLRCVGEREAIVRDVQPR
jgi:hypothetical protein